MILKLFERSSCGITGNFKAVSQSLMVERTRHFYRVWIREVDFDPIKPDFLIEVFVNPSMKYKFVLHDSIKNVLKKRHIILNFVELKRHKYGYSVFISRKYDTSGF
ncbi:MAG: hypothetical protein CVT92_05550 [Bacteroidetes bacterium HGW-Bacteroidetes-1]|jgi:hypothetical protein|nr:MAG: hypothetical protein CVT92_05550 [Bacteroidetes bacterium HGW-Bacteroidetes-1]